MEAARVRDEMSLQAAEASGAETADADADSADQPDGVKVVETLICSGTGEVLHAWQCSEADARVGFLKALSALSERFAQELPMGKFDRVEIQNAAGRGIAQVHADRMVFVRMGTEGLPV
jgi:hypothetical protein